MKTVVSNVVIALALLMSVAASAQESSSSMPRNWDAQVYGDIGIHLLSISVDTGFGSVSGSTTNFGLTFGGKATYRLSENLSVGPLAQLSFVFGSGATYEPIDIAAAVTFDKSLPVELTGAVGFAVVPGTGTGTTPAGVGILAQALYPLPSMPNLGIHAQLVENILSNGFNLFQITAGVAYKF